MGRGQITRAGVTDWVTVEEVISVTELSAVLCGGAYWKAGVSVCYGNT